MIFPFRCIGREVVSYYIVTPEVVSYYHVMVLNDIHTLQNSTVIYSTSAAGSVENRSVMNTKTENGWMPM